MYVIIVFRPLLKPWKKVTVFENNVAYVNKKGVRLEFMYRDKDKNLHWGKHKVFKMVNLIIEDDRYNRMNGRFK